MDLLNAYRFQNVTTLAEAESFVSTGVSFVNVQAKNELLLNFTLRKGTMETGGGGLHSRPAALAVQILSIL